jgi:hypothetical protein
MIAIAMRVEARKPIPKYIIGSIASSALISSSDLNLFSPRLAVGRNHASHGG